MSNNCQIPTPIQYVKTMLDYAGYQKGLYGKKILENSCGEGNVLCEIARRYVKDAMNLGYSKTRIVAGLERDIEAYETDKEKIEICMERLNAVLREYDIEGVRWNIHNSDYLKARTKKYSYVIGNPPYITYHDMSEKQRKWLKKKFKSCKRGRFDYCYAFIEKSLNSLATNGILVYLVPYSIIKNKFASDLRKIMIRYVTEIYDYSGIKIFPEAITSSIIIKCNNQTNGKEIQFFPAKNSKMQKYDRNKLDDKWSFEKVEKKERHFDDYFEICNSVATLLNEAFLLKKYEETDDYIIAEGFPIEKELVYPAISTKSVNKKYLIIFPYSYKGGRIIHYDVEEFERKFPGATNYLKNYYDKLSKRKKDQKAQWFEYGRSQALNKVFGRKLVMPMVITNSVNINYGGKNEIPYAGYFIRCRRGSGLQLKDAKKILESPHFYDYVQKHGTPTTPSSYRISVDDIKKYKF